ncbi:MAG: 4Fe-4S binding protein [Desulfobacterota bacterium]|nr:4Fe-4S binding protein [Thermodesulfobacteriota bacterium]
MSKPLTPLDIQRLQRRGQELLLPRVPRITVGCATCGCARGAEEVFRALQRHLSARGIPAQLDRVGCSGWCSKEPLVTVHLPGMPKITYGDFTPQDVPDLIGSIAAKTISLHKALYRLDAEENIMNGTPLTYTHKGRSTAREVPSASALPYFKHQKRLVLRNCGIIDPLSLEQYCGRGGLSAVCAALTRMEPEQVIDEISRGGLRGRGGAGFPTATKWSAARAAPGKKKYIICNADEGDPGAYMDRNILESDPFSVLEGMLIAGYAIGAQEGIVYVRREYPHAVATISRAIRIMRRAGLFGRNILETSFNFAVRVVQGAGAFVCGEETALIASLEGRQGEPRPRPPYPVEHGLHGMPTCINNVETLATVPVIIARGGKWFSRIGTRGNSGTKVFSLVGAVKHVGLIEVPLGVSLKNIVQNIGGGAADGTRVKAVQTGGPSGGCIPVRRMDVPVTYEDLAALGSIMGSGGMIVVDEKTCMVDLAKFFMAFLKDESCGKCLPCREGIAAAYTILDAITRGTATMADLDRLRMICEALEAASLCGLGRTAANPVLTTLRYFKFEYGAHINRRSCPAGVCAALIRLSIDARACIGCGACVKACPAGAVSGLPKKVHRINQKACIACKACSAVCPVGAVIIS